jgi:ABC-type sugar transport system ATPase subunit
MLLKPMDMQSLSSVKGYCGMKARPLKWIPLTTGRFSAGFIDASAGPTLDVKVHVSELLGSETLIYSKIGSQDFVARIDSRANISVNATIKLAIDMNKAIFFDKTTEKRIR